MHRHVALHCRAQALAERQHLVVAARQLLDLGLTRSMIWRMREDGRLVSRHRGVYLWGPPSGADLQEYMAGQLAAGDEACVTGGAAASMYGFWPFRSFPREVLVPRHHRGLEGWRVRETRTLAPRDTVRLRRIWITSPARTALELAHSLPAEKITRILREQRHVRRFRREAIVDVIDRNHGRRAATVLRGALVGFLGGSAGVRSELELRLLTHLRRRGVEPPLFNVAFVLDGTTIEPDYAWHRHSIILELDGPEHDMEDQRIKDAARDRLLCAHGWTVIRIRADDYACHPDGALAGLPLPLAR